MKNKPRRLDLRRETLRRLSTLSREQLEGVAGGAKQTLYCPTATNNCGAGTTTYRCGGG